MRKTTTPADKQRKDAHTQLAEAIAVYLSAIGWKALVVGQVTIEQKPTDAKLNYELVVRFTGGKVNSEEGKSA